MAKPAPRGPARPKPKPKPTKPAGTSTGAAMLVPGYGVLRLHCTSLAHGVSIVASESSSRNGKAIYVTAKTSGSFSMGLAFYSFAEYEKFSKVLLHYGLNLNSYRVGSPCRVMVPSVLDKDGKPFNRVGIPRNAIPFGDDVSTRAYRANLDFIGTTDPYSPVGVTDTGLVSNVIGSEYAQAIKKDPQAKYFYPIGQQLTGSNYGVDTLYDTAPGETAFEEPDESEAEPPPPPRRFTPGGTRRPGGDQEF